MTTHALLILILIAIYQTNSRPAEPGENWETIKSYGIMALIASPFIALYLLLFG